MTEKMLAGKKVCILCEDMFEDLELWYPAIRMREEGAEAVGGVMHCFTETQEVAEAAMALGFHISLSGIVTFKNAVALKDVARRIPLDRLLVETDSPYLAPVPYRGRTNHPGLVRHVAEEIARLRGQTLEEIAKATTGNFFALFRRAVKLYNLQ